MTPPPENPLNNVLVQQMFAKMKNFAAYGGIIYTFFRYTFFTLQGENLRLRRQYCTNFDCCLQSLFHSFGRYFYWIWPFYLSGDLIAVREQLDALFWPILWKKRDFLVPQRQEALFEAKMKRKRLFQWNFEDFSTSFGEIFLLRTHTPLPTFRQTPPP